MDSLNTASSVQKQYANADNLNTRIAFQQRFSQNTYGFSRWLMDQYDFPASARVLELGCGTGSMWAGKEELAASFSRLVLTDFSSGMLEEAKANLAGLPKAEFLQADIQSLPFENGEFDFIIANMMLYHVPDKAKAISEVRRVLRPGGTFVCATYGEEGLPSYIGAILRGVVEIRPLNTTFTLQNGGAMLQASFDRVEKREYPDEFLVDDADAIVSYLMSMTNMVVAGEDFPAEQVRAILAEKIQREGPLHIPKQYGTFLCK